MSEIIHIDPTTPDQALASPRPTSENPAAVYLAGLQSERSRRVMHNALRTLAALLAGATATEDVKAAAADIDPLAVRWEHLRYQHTTALRTRLIDLYSTSSANRMLAALRGVLKACWRLGYIDEETRARACDIANVRGETVPAGRDLHSGELNALLDDCHADKNAAGGIRDAAIIALLYACGLRRAEVAALTLADIDAEAGRLHVHGKGNKQRYVYATNGTLAYLRDWLALRASEPGALFWPVNKGGRIVAGRGISAQAVYDMLKKRGDRAGLKDFSPHDFRRTFAGDMLDAGVDLVTVQKIMGHASVTTTGRYDRRGERSKQDAAARLHVPYRQRV